MQPILIITLTALACAPLGLWLQHNFATLGYRREDELDLPHPGPRWWVVWASVLALATVAAGALPVAVAGSWLAAVDSDVLRIPNRVLLPTGVATLLAIAGVAAAAQGWRTVLVPVVAALINGAVFAAVHRVTKGGIGFGDVKLAAVIGLAAGSLGVGAAWLSVLVGSVSALAWAKASGKVGPIPYGPWLLCGTWIGADSAAIIRR